MPNAKQLGIVVTALISGLTAVSCGSRDAARGTAPAPQSAETAAVAAADELGVVAADANLVQPLSAGAKAPKFWARKPDGTRYEFDPASRAAPAVMIFYRGGWCPYCNAHMGQLKAAEATLRQRGYEVLFMSSDRPEILFSSLKDDIEKEVAHYTLLSDADAQVARAFGVAFQVDAATVEQYKGFGIDLEQTQGNAAHVLPVPSVFVIGKDGKIVFAHFDPDYKERLSAEKLLAVAL